MGIISTLKSVLGVGDERGPDRGTSVTVEREPRAVGDGPSAEQDEEPAATERAVKGMDGAAIAEESTAADPSGTGESVDAIKGIGAAYAERLAEAGVETVADLAAADPDTLAEETDIGAGRLEGWVEQARARTE